MKVILQSYYYPCNITGSFLKKNKTLSNSKDNVLDYAGPLWGSIIGLIL